MVLRVNLASTPFANRRLILLACLFVVAASALVAIDYGRDLRRVQRESAVLAQELNKQQHQIAALQGKIPPPVRKEQLGPEERVALQSASTLLESRIFSWSRMLAEIERELSDGVRLTAVSVTLADASKVDALNPGRAPLRVSMVMVGKDLKQILDTLDRMRKAGRFGTFSPRKESVVEGTQEVELEFESTYLPS
ncbi:MAG: hypothetical protein HY650_12960 [Acidobacteria bacterium]|nr:hypothetical protein [Acidobacteriota bacterium]